MPRRLCLVALAALVLVTFAACASDDDRQRTAAPATGDAAVTVTVANMSFSPKTLEVAAGETVAWVWDTDTTHDVAFEDGPTSPKQKSGTWQRTFDRPGSFDYACTLHPGMRATVAVR
jgi:plastocyanin